MQFTGLDSPTALLLTGATAMYLQNKYTIWYNNIITRAKSRNLDVLIIEKHHIIPKSFFKKYDPHLGWICGDYDDPNNIVNVTPKEHYILHLCLVKMTAGVAKMKMIYALRMLSSNRNGICKSSRVYEMMRKEFASIKLYWWTNGIIDILSPVSPGVDYYRGRLPSHATVKGRKWWNNGVISVRQDECPGPEWSHGMISTVWNKGKRIGYSWTDGNIYKFSINSPGPNWKKEGPTKNKPRPRPKDSNSNHRGTSWWNNGIDRKRSVECPGPGWVKGSGLITSGTKGRKWYNNGHQSIVAFSCPPGWIQGRLC